MFNSQLCVFARSVVVLVEHVRGPGSPNDAHRSWNQIINKGSEVDAYLLKGTGVDCYQSML